MLARRLRRRPSINPALGQRLASAGYNCRQRNYRTCRQRQAKVIQFPNFSVTLKCRLS